MEWKELTEQQRSAADATVGRTIVVGAAGSGKTTVALWCAKRFLESDTAKSWHRVLFLTFSRTAVREIARRSGRALANLTDRVEIQTFHAFANRLIASFGRYAGFGKNLPPFQSAAEVKLLGRRTGHVGYDDLLPMALAVMRTPRVNRLLSERWPVVICDEFQDTDDEQWELLRELARGARLVLLADPNQMIYDGFLGERGVGPQRLEQAMAEADCVIDLGAPSHRDPTNVIPAMAAAVRERKFDHSAVRKAIEEDRLRIYGSVEADRLLGLLETEIAEARAIDLSVGVFAHGNQRVADLSAELLSRGIDHVLVGLPEAHGEALATLEALCLFGAHRLAFEDARHYLALFLAASVRNDEVPLAVALDGGSSLPPGLEKRLDAVRDSLPVAADQGLPELVRAATVAWPSLGILAGRRSWNQAARTFGAMAQLSLIRSRSQPDAFFAELARQIHQQRLESFFDLDIGAGYSVHLMNFHQTKGRETDLVILVFRGNDWFGREAEPFNRNSRLLYVSLTRARKRCVVILPSDPHPLVAPFVDLLE